MAQRFESEPEAHRDAMTDTEVREVLSRLAQEKVSPKVGDVADIAGASEADVRRVLAQLRAEQAAVPVTEETAPEVRASPFLMGRSTNRIPVVIAISVALLLLGVMMMFSTHTVEPVKVAGPPQEVAIDQAAAPAPVSSGN